MNIINKTAQEAELLCSVAEGQWGTIGPHFLNANQVIAKHAGVKHALVTFSASAALETILRGKNIGCGDEVVIASWSDPVDSMTVAAVGATPVFANVSQENPTLTPDAIAQVLTEKTMAIIADLSADIAGLSAHCKEKGIYFILNLGDAWGAAQHGIPVHQYADSAFVDMSEGCALDLGLAGAIITDSEEDFPLFYAYHNCGRPMGDGATLSFDEIIGGDLRVCEWQSVMIPGRLAQLEEKIARSGGKGIAQKSLCVNMAEAPFWNTDYYKKLTGNQ